MPVINAAYTTWNSAHLPIPSGPDPTNLVWSWDNAYRFLVGNINIKQVSTLDFDTATNKGSPQGTIWTVGDRVWQVDVSIPFLIPPGDESQTPPLFPTSFTEPYCANIPVVSDVAYPLAWFLYAAITPIVGRPIYPVGTELGLWDTHWAIQNPARQTDIFIRSLSVEVNESRSMLTMSLLCSDDPRAKFDIRQSAVTNGFWRTAMPWDFVVPSGVEHLGAPNVAYEGGYGAVTPIPHRIERAAGTNFGMVREWGFTIESQISQFKSVGTPSARPLLGVTSTTCRGTLKYIPLKVTELGMTLVGDDDRVPVGWMVDTQALETITRSGGQLYLAGQPPYTDPMQPLYLGMNLVKGDPMGTTYTVLDKDILGPIGVAVASFDAAAGSENTVSIDFRTLLGFTGDELSSVLSGS